MPIDEQHIVPRDAVERYVRPSIRHRFDPKAVLADQHVLPDGNGARDVKAIPDRCSEARYRPKGVGQPALRQTHQILGMLSYRPRPYFTLKRVSKHKNTMAALLPGTLYDAAVAIRGQPGPRGIRWEVLLGPNC